MEMDFPPAWKRPGSSPCPSYSVQPRSKDSQSYLDHRIRRSDLEVAARIKTPPKSEQSISKRRFARRALARRMARHIIPNHPSFLATITGTFKSYVSADQVIAIQSRALLARHPVQPARIAGGSSLACAARIQNPSPPASSPRHEPKSPIQSRAGGKDVLSVPLRVTIRVISGWMLAGGSLSQHCARLVITCVHGSIPRF